MTLHPQDFTSMVIVGVNTPVAKVRKGMTSASQAMKNKRVGGARSFRVRPTTRAITVDDVIRDLLELLKQVGNDPSHVERAVRRVGAMPLNELRPYEHSAAIGDLLTLWHQDPRFTDDSGNPLPLKFKGRARSFGELARESIPGISAKQVLQDLHELGAVATDSRGYVHPLRRSLNVYQDKELATTYTLSTLRWFIKTLSHNLESEPSNADQLFNRIAWNGVFPTKDIPKLKLWLSKHGQSLLLSADNWMMDRAKHEQSRRSDGKSAQIAVGLYMAVDET